MRFRALAAGRQGPRDGSAQMCCEFPPKEKLSVDFGARHQTLPTNPAFFFPLFKRVGSGSRWRSEGKKKKGKGRGGGDSPRAGGRYCMYVH